LILVCFAQIVFSKQPEEYYLEQLQSGNLNQIQTACSRLPVLYPDSSNAVTQIRGILYNYRSLKITQDRAGADHKPHQVTADPILACRACARALGNYHITATDKDLSVIFTELVESHDSDTAMDGLKSIRGMTAPQAVPLLLPLLNDGNVHVLRDTIRTLGVIGDDSVIPHLEPLLHSHRIDVV
jgi:hypothetical protein